MGAPRRLAPRPLIVGVAPTQPPRSLGVVMTGLCPGWQGKPGDPEFLDLGPVHALCPWAEHDKL